MSSVASNTAICTDESDMEVWRLTRQRHRDNALNGAGARLSGNRWNSKGTAVAYTSISLELAVLESLMHINLDEIPTDSMWLRFFLPDDTMETLGKLPKGWDAPGRPQPQVQAVGDAWVQSGTSLGLRVPATVLPIRMNVLLNPSHPRFGEVELLEEGSFTWPQRLLSRLGA